MHHARSLPRLPLPTLCPADPGLCRPRHRGTPLPPTCSPSTCGSVPTLCLSLPSAPQILDFVDPDIDARLEALEREEEAAAAAHAEVVSGGRRAVHQLAACSGGGCRCERALAACKGAGWAYCQHRQHLASLPPARLSTQRAFVPSAATDGEGAQGRAAFTHV